jgi:hypothetical protein
MSNIYKKCILKLNYTDQQNKQGSKQSNKQSPVQLGSP